MIDKELMNYGKSSEIHRGLFVFLMFLDIWGNPGYMVPCNQFTRKYKEKLKSGEKLWP